MERKKIEMICKWCIPSCEYPIAKKKTVKSYIYWLKRMIITIYTIAVITSVVVTKATFLDGVVVFCYITIFIVMLIFCTGFDLTKVKKARIESMVKTVVFFYCFIYLLLFIMYVKP